jgi:hypothetical protein
MYYLWSLIATICIFGAIQYNEYTKHVSKKQPYNPYTITNLSTVVIMYILLTITFYMLLGIDNNCLKKIDKSVGRSKTKHGGENIHDMDTMIDPAMLRRIPEQVYTGFDPSSSCNDV